MLAFFERVGTETGENGLQFGRAVFFFAIRFLYSVIGDPILVI